LPDEQRSHRDVASTDQISMERVMTMLTGKEQAFVGSIGITGMSTHWTSKACIVRVYHDCHTLMQEGFIGNHALQLGKGPLGIGRIGLPSRYHRGRSSRAEARIVAQLLSEGVRNAWATSELLIPISIA
jgi:hypothetical protein